MYGGLIIPVVAGGAFAAARIFIEIEEKVGYPLPNWVFTILLTLFPFIGIRILDRLLIRLSLHFRRRDANGNPLEPPMRHTFWFIPLPVWSYLWLVLLAGFTIWGTVSPQTEEDKKRAEEVLERWIQKREASRS